MRGRKTPEAVKKEAAKRFHKGEDEELLAGELGIAVSTLRDWGKMFPDNPRRPKRRVIISQPKENTRVSELEKENRRLRGELEFWKNAYDATVTNSK